MTHPGAFKKLKTYYKTNFFFKFLKNDFFKLLRPILRKNHQSSTHITQQNHTVNTIYRFSTQKRTKLCTVQTQFTYNTIFRTLQYF